MKQKLTLQFRYGEDGFFIGSSSSMRSFVIGNGNSGSGELDGSDLHLNPTETKTSLFSGYEENKYVFGV